MRKLCIILLFLPLSLLAQKWEIGFGGGHSLYLGDLNQTIFSEKNGLSLNVGGKYNFNPHFGLRFDLLNHQIAGADSLSTSDAERMMRNLSFQSTIYEASLLFEINFFRFVPGNDDDRFTPYINGGLSLFSFNPKARFNGALIELQPLGTEGQTIDPQSREDRRYSRVSFAIPVAFGFKWNFTGQHSLALEAGMRFAFTDYIDDVSGSYADNSIIRLANGATAAQLADRSQELGLPLNDSGKLRGNPGFNDVFGFLGLRYTYTFNRGTCPAFR
jgi:hypothetical protein